MSSNMTVSPTGVISIGVTDGSGVVTWRTLADSIDIATVEEAAAAATTVYAHTATADGLTTGIIGDSENFVSVASASADHIITMPAGAALKTVQLSNLGTGYELRTTDPENIRINGGGGVDAEAAIPANATIMCVFRVAGTAPASWNCWQQIENGDLTKTEVAAP